MDYNKKLTEDKLRNLASPKTRRHARHSIFLYKYLLTFGIALTLLGLGLGVGFVRGIIHDAPRLSVNSIQKTSYSTTIYDNRNQKISSIQDTDVKKNYQELSTLPSNLQNAFIAVEDQEFYSHNEIDIYNMIKSVLMNIQSKPKNQGGGITSQLVENNILGNEYEGSAMERIENEIQKQYLSYKLEKITSKRTILEEYLNTINLGEGTTGVQAASKKYFNKDASALTLSESAVLAALAKDPAKYNPFKHPEANASQRLIVLQNMLEQHYITKTEYTEAINNNIYNNLKKAAASYSTNQLSDSDFNNALILQVVQDMKDQLGYDESKAYAMIYNEGLKIYSTQDSSIQKIAQKVSEDSSNYPSSTKYTMSYYLVTTTKKHVEHTYTEKDVLAYMKKYHLGNSLLFENRDLAKEMTSKFTSYLKNHGRKKVSESLHLFVQPQVSISIVNQYTGDVEALIGGRGKDNSSNGSRSVLNTEQPGTSFSILSSFLPALDQNHATLATVFNDAPYRYLDTNEEVKNQTNDYVGYTTIREAISESNNVIAAKVMSRVTPVTAYEYLTNLGFSTISETQSSNKGKTSSDIHQALALGSLTSGVTNLDITNAYATIANGGTYHTPKFYTKVVDRYGRVLLKNETTSKQVIQRSTAFLLTSAMEDAISTGTSKSGKLSNDITCAGSASESLKKDDAWFSGFTPYHTASVWMGYDTDTSFSSKNLQSRIWKKIMEQVASSEGNENIPFTKPSNIESALICKKSGKLAIPGLCDKDPRGDMTTKEFFTVGTVPKQTCDVHTKVKLCKETNELATDACPSTYEKVYLLHSKYNSAKTADSPFELPKNLKSCSKHSDH